MNGSTIKPNALNTRIKALDTRVLGSPSALAGVDFGYNHGLGVMDRPVKGSILQ